MFETEHSERTRAPAEAVWPIWAQVERWGQTDQRIERAELVGEGGLAVGSRVAVKLRRGGTTVYEVTELEPGRALVTETRFPGGRLGHERRLEPRHGGATISHRLYVAGPVWPLWALMLGRGRLRESVAQFARRERELVEPELRRDSKRKRRRR